MNEENLNVTSVSLADRLADDLTRGAILIESVDDAVYRLKSNASGTVGGHFRHNLDFVNLLLNGIQNGRIDYSNRERDVAIEEDREYAASRYAFAIMRVRRLPEDAAKLPLLVRSEIDPDVWHESSAGREIEFVCSHTVHHHALIAEKLAFFGVSTERGFGVAPSTLKFWETKDSDAVAA